MTQCIIRKLCNVEIELQPLVQEVDFNVEYASVRQHLGAGGGLLIWYWQASGEGWVEELKEGMEEK